MNLNKATLIGRLTRDPEVKSFDSGSKLSVLGIATNRSWLDSQTNSKKQTVEFHQVLAWGRLAELCNQFLKKGRQVYVEGRLQTRQWEDKDKKKNFRTEIVAENMIFLDRNAKVLTSSDENQAVDTHQTVKAEEIPIEEVAFAV